MSEQKAIKIKNKALADFYKRNRNFDVLNFDFYDKEAISGLKRPGGDTRLTALATAGIDEVATGTSETERAVEQLKTYQRLLRVHPDQAVAEKLLSRGFDSAHKIAATPEPRFVRENADLFDGDAQKARDIHRQATAIKIKVQHLFANVHSMVSPYFQGMLMNQETAPKSMAFAATATATPDTANAVNYFQGIPNYQELFGGLNYLKCQDCNSIFSPAAYFLDLMRIIDGYITDPNTHKQSANIPPSYKLKDRRPDLFELPLNCENTNEPIPFLQIVNAILERRIAEELQIASETAQAGEASSITLAANAAPTDGAYKGMTIRIVGGTGVAQVRTIANYVGSTKVATVDHRWKVVPDNTSQYIIAANPFQTLAVAAYPFNLPFNLPLVQTRRYLGSLNTSLSDIFTALEAPVTGGTAQAGTANTIQLAGTASGDNTAYNTMQIVAIAGKGAGQVRTITNYDGSTKQVTVNEAWQVVPDQTTQYHIFDHIGADREYLGLSIEQYRNLITVRDSDGTLAPVYGYQTIDLNAIARVQTFLERTGLNREQLNELLTQNLSKKELNDNLANNLYINNTGENLPYMQIVIDDSNRNEAYYKIANLSLKRLDRLSRFFRLATQLQWSYAALDWALVSIGAMEITEKVIKAIAGIKRLQNTTVLTVEELCSFWHDMKTIGKGDGRYPADLFDQTFNNPGLLDGQNPYTSTNPIPFDPARPLQWSVNDTTGQNGIIRGRLLAALQVSDNDLTVLGRYILSLLEQAGNPLSLTLTNLTWLYRLARSAAIFKITVDEYLQLLGMMYYPNASSFNTSNYYSLPPANSLNPTVDKIVALKEKVDWFKSQSLTVYQTLYIMKGFQSSSFKASYQTSDIASFIENLSTISAGTRLSKDSFRSGDIDASRSEQIFTELQLSGYLSPIGIVLNHQTKYQQAADQLLLNETSFQTEGINQAESQQVYQYLQQSHSPILKYRDSSSATLSYSFNKDTDLNFLFAGSQDESVAVNKRNAVRSILLQIRDKVYIAEFAFLFPLNQGSFIITNLIDSSNSEKVFQSLKNQQIVTASNTLSPNFDKNTSLDFLFTEDPQANLKRGQVKRQLIGIKQNIERTADIVHEAETLQERSAMQGLADFIGTTPDMLAALIPFATKETSLSNFVQYLLTPIQRGQIPADIPPLVAALSRAWVLFDSLAFSIDQVKAVVEMPSVFNIDDTTQLTFANIISLSTFKSLVSAFNDRDNALIAYFKLPEDANRPGLKVQALAQLVGLPQEQINQLIDRFWRSSAGNSQFDYKTITGVNRLKQSFVLARKTGMDIQSLLQLNNLSNLPLMDGTDINSNNWQTYTDLAVRTLGSVKAKFGHEEFAGVNKDITCYLNERKRDALLGYIIWVLNHSGKLLEQIQKASDLYQYLLIDVEMSGCDSVSYIAQGIASLQLYLQRCRMMLEPGVTDLSNIPNIWWQWMSAYRIWEANRKIFLYPENYLDPTLRSNQTPELKKFADSLLQTDITKYSVAKAYTNYFQDVSILANLVHCESYSCKISKPGTETGEVNTLFLFGRTNTQPYTYYYRQFDNQQSWTAWQKIDLKINANYISPVYAFKKLFIFWVELNSINSSKVNAKDGGTESIPISYTTAAIKCSFLNSNGIWNEPQTIATDIVVDYEENYELDPSYVGVVLPLMKPSFKPANIYWQKVYALYAPHVNSNNATTYPNGDNICINYGFGLEFSQGHQLPLPAPPKTNIPPNQLKIEQNVYNLVTKFNEITTAPIQYSKGYLQYIQSLVLDGNLNKHFLNTAVISNLPIDNPQPYYPILDREKGELGVNQSASYNIIIDSYHSDDFAENSLQNNSSDTTRKLLLNIAKQPANLVTVKNQPGSFIFDNGDEAFLVVSQEQGIKHISEILKAQTTYTSFPNGNFYLDTGSYTNASEHKHDSLDDEKTFFNGLTFKFTRLSTNALVQLNKKLVVGGIDNLLTIGSQQTPELSFARLQPQPSAVINPVSDEIDFYGSYGAYFWEIFFHAPFLVAATLNANKKFEEAKNWYQYLFNPTQSPQGDTDNNQQRFWRFLPFRTMTLETLTQILTNPAQIEAYNNKPFDPDAIARLRMSAYAKAIVMKYIDNLLDWGDYLYQQDTRESITQATNLYVIAADLLGKRPEAVGDVPVPTPKSFNDIQAEYNDKTVTTGTAQQGSLQTITLAANASSQQDAYTGMYITITGGVGQGQKAYITSYNGSTKVAVIEGAWTATPNNTSQYRIFVNGIPQFLIRLENTSPMTGSAAAFNYSDLPFNTINSYFCVPENEDLTAYWDRVEDRLYKIRHCMNIQGQVRSLALFAPPIDPRQLIRAASSSGGSLSLLSQMMDVQIPNYRFAILIEKAKSFTSNLMQLGSSLLNALEKKDAEALALLRFSQEKNLLSLMTFSKEQQIEELAQMEASLQQSQQSANKRFDHYTDLVAKGLSPAEITNIVAMTAAMYYNVVAGITRTAAAIGYAVPQLGSPFAMTYGGQQIGSALTAASGAAEIGAVVSNFAAQLSITMAGYERRTQEWQLQADLASFDQEQIKYQIEANKIRKKIAERELEVHQTTVKQNEEMEAFLKDKFTNQELYQWMVTQLSTVYFQTYSLAIDLARAAQRAYQFELNSDRSFVNFGYWDSLHKGLLAGEGLMLALNQMEKAYLDNHTRTLEIEKTISLLQLNPEALLHLIETGECIFELSEKLFDNDYPGHYARKIKSISISIPAIVGPYQNIKATLTQLSNQIVVKPNKNATNFLLGGADATMLGADTLPLRSNWWVNQQIAVSRGIDDSGMFVLNFNDERYLPFEGTGAVSSWRLSMPKATNRLDFKNISDVIIQLKYTALDGGTKFKQDVTGLDAMKPYYGSNFFMLSKAFPQQWYALLHERSSTESQTMEFELANLVPSHVENATLAGFYFKLNVAGNMNLAGNYNYIQLKLSDEPAVTLNLDGNGSYTHSFQTKLPISTVTGKRSLTFQLGTTPDVLKTKPEPQSHTYLNPEVIQDIVLILFYEGELQCD